MKTEVNTVTINGVEYVRADSLPAQKPAGNRAVIVIDRGWIYAGDVEESNGRIVLHNPVWVFNWKSVGFAAVIEDPSQADIRPVKYPIDIPSDAEIYRIPVPADWGLK